MMFTLKSVLIFILAGIAEIGGGYLVWLWLKQGKPWWVGLLGGGILALYGVIATLQTENFARNFARVYATYGGFFIAMSILWAMKFDNFSPDKYDLIGALVALLGVCIIYYAPRG